MTFRDFEVVGYKHVRRRGPNVTAETELRRATETHFLCTAIDVTHDYRFGLKVVALTPTETIPPAVLVALQAGAQQWIDDHPAGDPGTPTRSP